MALVSLLRVLTLSCGGLIMFESDDSIAYFAIMQWVRYIETGSFTGLDKKKMLELAESDRGVKRIAESLPVLAQEQQEFVYRLEDLAAKIINEKPLSGVDGRSEAS